MSETNEMNSNSGTKILVINIIHIIVFSSLVFYFNYCRQGFKMFSLEWSNVSQWIKYKWSGLLNMYLSGIHSPISIFHEWGNFNDLLNTGIIPLVLLLFPVNSGVLLVLLSIKRGYSRISSYGYTLIFISLILPLLFTLNRLSHDIKEFGFENVFPVYAKFVIPEVVALLATTLPLFLFGLFNREPIESTKDETFSIWSSIFLLPLIIVRKVIDFAETKKSNWFLYTVILIVGFNVAAKVAELIYEVIILSTIIPIAIFVIIWTVIIIFVIWLAFKFFFGGKSEESSTSTRETTYVPKEKKYKIERYPYPSPYEGYVEFRPIIKGGGILGMFDAREVIGKDVAKIYPNGEVFYKDKVVGKIDIYGRICSTEIGRMGEYIGYIDGNNKKMYDADGNELGDFHPSNPTRLSNYLDEIED